MQVSTDRTRETRSAVPRRPPARPARGATLRLSRPADPGQLREIRREVYQWAALHRLPADTVVDLQLALGEAAANGVEHAYRRGPAGRIEVKLDLGASRVLVEVADHGRWRPLSAVAGYRGRGLDLIRALAERVEVDPTHAGTRVRFEIPTRRS